MCKFTFSYVLLIFFFWAKLTYLMFSEPKLKVVFLACCVWVGKGICPGQKLVLQMALHMFQNFFFLFYHWICGSGSGRLWGALVGSTVLFSSPRKSGRPRAVSALRSLGGTLFHFPRCGGCEPRPPARPSRPALP